jgi:hypothetical protein
MFGSIVRRGDKECLDTQSVAVVVSYSAAPSKTASIPALAHQHPDGIVAAANKLGHVVCVVNMAVVVRLPAGREDVVTNTLAVDLCFVESQRRDVETCRSDVALDVEVLAKVYRSLGCVSLCLAVGCDGNCVAPIRCIQQACLDRSPI